MTSSSSEHAQELQKNIRIQATRRLIIGHKGLRALKEFAYIINKYHGLNWDQVLPRTAPAKQSVQAYQEHAKG